MIKNPFHLIQELNGINYSDDHPEISLSMMSSGGKLLVDPGTLSCEGHVETCHIFVRVLE